MSLEVAINTNSLRMIREELNAAITRSANEFEAYLVDNQDKGPLANSANEIKQVGGTFRLIEFPGAALIADTMAAVLTGLAESEDATLSEELMQALTHGYFVLPRYLEYVAGRQSELPILVIPYVNEILAANRQPLIPEYHFFDKPILSEASSLPAASASQLDEFLSSVKRLRHMYQTGLLKVIKEQGSMAGNFLLMSRALERACNLLGDHQQREIWLLAKTVVEAFGHADLEITLNRKRSLAAVEKLFRLAASKGQEGLDTDPGEALKTELQFMLMLCTSDLQSVTDLKQAYGFAQPELSDQQLAEQREMMHGPSVDTFESVIKVLKDEIRSAKDILELASQNGSIIDEELATLLEVTSRVSDTLSVINLQGPSNTLKEQLSVMQTWQQDDTEISSEAYLEAADSLLYIESSLSGLDRRELTIQDLNEASVLTRKKIIASSHLAEAEGVVIAEAQAGIALAKRAITSYVDSNFDSAHISNVSITLNTVRGGLNILGYTRASAVIKSCINFIDSHVKGDTSGQRHQLLETLADALISLEYYLMELESTTPDEKILDLAEESLDALGFAVET